jgi:site-specific recombinase XerC
VPPAISSTAENGPYPEWFATFLTDRAISKPSPHTAKAYRQDFTAIATLLAGDAVSVADLTLESITKDSVRQAFAIYADSHEPASIRRCWSTWNTLCSFLYSSELIPANPMPLIGRPKVAKTLPKALGADTVTGLLAVIDADDGSSRRADWTERDRALVLTSQLAGLRPDELLRANVGDIRITEGGGVIHVRGKGGTDRRIPVEGALIDVLESYLESRAVRFPGSTKRRVTTGIANWPASCMRP